MSRGVGAFQKRVLDVLQAAGPALRVEDLKAELFGRHPSKGDRPGQLRITRPQTSNLNRALESLAARGVITMASADTDDRSPRVVRLVLADSTTKSTHGRGVRQFRASLGGAYEARGRFFMRVTVAAGKRHAEALPWVSAEQWAMHGTGSPCPCVACERARHVQELVNRLREAAQLDLIEKLVESAASADALQMAELARGVDDIIVKAFGSERSRVVQPRSVQPGQDRFDEVDRTYLHYLDERCDRLEERCRRLEECLARLGHDTASSSPPRKAVL